MLVVAKNAEQKLGKDLDRAQVETPSLQCLYLPSSIQGENNAVFMDKFFDILSDIPNSYRVQIYVCKNRDVFILLQAFMADRFMDALKNLSDFIDGIDIKSGIRSFQVGRDRNELDNLFESDPANDLEKHDPTSMAKKVQEKFASLDMHAAVSISQRRMARTGVHVMIVEDDQVTRVLTGNALKKECSVSFSERGLDAISEYVSCSPDVLFLDIGLPDISGHDVLEYVFQLDPDAFIIMLSGRTDPGNMMRALKAGAQGFIGKPFTREKLFEYIQKSPFVQSKDKAEDIRKNHA